MADPIVEPIPISKLTALGTIPAGDSLVPVIIWNPSKHGPNSGGWDGVAISLTLLAQSIQLAAPLNFTGGGPVVLQDAPTINNARLGVPLEIDLANATNLPSNALANMNSGTLKGRYNSVGTGTPEDIVLAGLLQNYLSGLNTAWASLTTFTIAPGVAAGAANTFIMSLNSTLTKSTSAWAVGSGNGGLDTGAIAANTWYHIHLIRRPDTGIVDALISLSPTAPTMPTGYTQRRRIASIKTSGASQFLKWIQDGDRFVWDVPPQDVLAANPGTAAVTRTLSVPLGVNVVARTVTGLLAQAGATGGTVYLSDLSITDTAAGTGGAASVSGFNTSGWAGVFVGAAPVEVRTNTLSQIRSRIDHSDANTTLFIDTLGWIDARGRNG